MDTRNKQSFSPEDIAFIQSSYRDAKRKPSQREKLKDLYPYVIPAEFAELTGTPVTDWEMSTKPTRAKKIDAADKPAHDPVLDRLVFRSFDLLV